MHSRSVFAAGWIVLIVAAAGLRTPAEAASATVVEAVVDVDAGLIGGVASVTVRGGRDASLEEAVFLLYPDRFRREPEAIDDLARQHLVWSGAYRPGGTNVSRVEVSGRVVEAMLEESDDGPSRLRVSLDPPLAPGDSRRVRLHFETHAPNLRDVFGARDGLWIAAEGWFPVALDGSTPSAGDVRLSLAIPDGADALLGGRRFRGPERIVARGDFEALAPLIVSGPPIETRERLVEARRVVVHRLPAFELPHRVGASPPPEAALDEALDAIVPRLRDADDVVVIRAPLGWIPSWSSREAVIVSDRLFELFPELRPLHARELAYAVFLAEERRAATMDEPAWIAEGLAWRRAEELYDDELRRGREVRDWIRLFDVFAIVDRFETAPRIPLVRPFFPVRSSDDALGLRFPGRAPAAPPGRLLFDELERHLGRERFSAWIGTRAEGSLVERLSREARAIVEARADRAPVGNFALRAVERSPRGIRVTLGREGVEGPPQGIPLAVGAERLTVEVGDDPVAFDVAAAEDAVVQIDPERRLLQTRLDDDRDPPELQLLLDSADVEVSSTEFGFSTLFVARNRYDYRKDLAVAPFITDRGFGAHGGFQIHGGPAIDRNLFRRNLFLYYAAQELDRDFGEDGADAARAGGRLAGFGLRYNDFDAYWFENPSRAHHLRLFVDGYDRALGSRYGFVQAGGSLAVTRALRADWVVAAQVLAGFTIRTGERAIPPQGLYSLGGFRSIRGIAADEALDRHLLIGRIELRHLLPLRLDLSLDDLLVARRLQAKGFVDAGRVAGRARRLGDVDDFAVGAGVGVNLFYDFLGFFPTSFYVDLATRVDRGAGLQVLFGARQPF